MGVLTVELVQRLRPEVLADTIRNLSRRVCFEITGVRFWHRRWLARLDIVRHPDSLTLAQEIFKIILPVSTSLDVVEKNIKEHLGNNFEAESFTDGLTVDMVSGRGSLFQNTFYRIRDGQKTICVVRDSRAIDVHGQLCGDCGAWFPNGPQNCT